MSEPESSAVETLWSVELPRQRLTKWHQTFQELVVHIGQAVGLAVAFGVQKGQHLKVDVDIDAGHVHILLIGADGEEFVALDASAETVN